MRRHWLDIPGVKVARQDWTDAQSYRTLLENTQSHPDDAREIEKQWAWEFLRRRPSYQADYLEWRRLPDKRRRVENALRAAKYFLDGFVPPIERFPAVIPFRNTFGVRIVGGDATSSRMLDHPLRELLPASSVAIFLDLRLPLPLQLELAAIQLSERIGNGRPPISPSIPRKEFRRFRFLIRLLDAKAAGVRNAELAGQMVREGIYRSAQASGNDYGKMSLDKDLHRAITLRDSDELLLLPYRASTKGRKVISKILSVSRRTRN